MGFIRSGENRTVEMLPGVKRTLISRGERAMIVQIELAAGSVVPHHQHPYEQVGFVASGQILMTIAGEQLLLSPGDSYSIPSDVFHSAESPQGCTVYDIFSPIRPDYL